MLFDTDVDWLRAYPKCLKIKLCVRRTRKWLFKLEVWALMGGGIAQGQHNIVSVPVMWLYFLSQSISNRFVQVVETLCLESKSLAIYAMKCPNWRRTLQNWLDTRISVFATLLLCSQYMYNGKAIYWFYQCLNLAI